MIFIDSIIKLYRSLLIAVWICIFLPIIGYTVEQIENWISEINKINDGSITDQ